ncbi:class F sortase [Streptomyces sp. NPDC021356]|uniref:class F sortase n=1 Tax=Streptomyces sp. NPDC021356 TaxID=3154900 RepID=UPI0033FFF875
MAFQRPPQTERSGTGNAPRRGRLRLLWPAAAVGLGLVLIHQSLGTAPVTSPRQAGRPTAAAPRATRSAQPAPSTSTEADDGALPRSAPERISIPEISVDAPFTKLSLDPTGHLSPPPADDTNLVGWFQDGASPGERGASIVAGHVDTTTGPAVFAGLESLSTGDSVDITREDGIVAHFEVDAVDTFSKANFPDDEVYADTPTPELRLITCGGNFNRTSQDYESNVVVFAHLDSSSPS